ncbi:MAG: hypothetical protein HXY36_00330 [Chloroflexi bacterium]|nr:hypothetical protein [Chloroflexota bacterium]
MSHSFEQDYEEQLAMQDDLVMLREDLISELQAINQYESHIFNLENEEAVNTLEHIVEEEKEHIAELLRLIQNLDLAQAEKFKGIL